MSWSRSKSHVLFIPVASSFHWPCDIPGGGRNQQPVKSLDKAQIACTDMCIFLSEAQGKRFSVLFSVCPDMDTQSKKKKITPLTFYFRAYCEFWLLFTLMVTDLYYHCPSSYTLHKAGLLLVHISWQEGWTGVSSPSFTSLLGPPMSAGFPPTTLQMPFSWNSMGHKLSKGRAQGCWTSEGSTCPSLVRGSHNSSEDNITLLSARFTLSQRMQHHSISSGCLLGTHITPDWTQLL